MKKGIFGLLIIHKGIFNTNHNKKWGLIWIVYQWEGILLQLEILGERNMKISKHMLGHLIYQIMLALEVLIYVM